MQNILTLLYGEDDLSHCSDHNYRQIASVMYRFYFSNKEEDLTFCILNVLFKIAQKDASFEKSFNDIISFESSRVGSTENIKLLHDTGMFEFFVKKAFQQNNIELIKTFFSDESVYQLSNNIINQALIVSAKHSSDSTFMLVLNYVAAHQLHDYVNLEVITTLVRYHRIKLLGSFLSEFNTKIAQAALDIAMQTAITHHIINIIEMLLFLQTPKRISPIVIGNAICYLLQSHNHQVVENYLVLNGKSEPEPSQWDSILSLAGNFGLDIITQYILTMPRIDEVLVLENTNQLFQQCCRKGTVSVVVQLIMHHECLSFTQPTVDDALETACTYTQEKIISLLININITSIMPSQTAIDKVTSQ